MHAAARRQRVVAEGLVHRGAVVPDHHVAHFPAVTVHEFGPRAVRQQLADQRVALPLAPADDLDRGAVCDIEAPAASDRVRAYEWVHDVRVRILMLVARRLTRRLGSARRLLTMTALDVPAEAVDRL